MKATKSTKPTESAKSKQKRNTLILIAVLAVLIIGGTAIKYIFFQKEGATAIIQQKGTIIHELKLNHPTELDIEDGYGGTNHVVVKDNTIYVDDANCDDRVCVFTGAISQTGQVIACLPHELIITIKNDGEDGLDTTAW